MYYATERIYRSLVGHAWQRLRAGAGSNDVLSRAEQRTLGDRLNTAAEAVRRAKGPGARIRTREVLDVYATSLAGDIDDVNQVCPKWLSAREVDAIEDPKLRGDINAARAWMREARQRPDRRRGPTGLYRRQLAATYAPTYSESGSKKIKVAFIDADSTLRTSRSGKVSPSRPRDVALLPFVGARIADLIEQGYLIAIVSNQSGVSAGYVTLENADASLQRVADLVREAGGDVHWFDFAERRDANRKPEIGMALRLERTLRRRFGDAVRIDRERSVMIGDAAYKKGERRPDGRPGTDFSNSDRRFAENLGVDFFEPDRVFGWDRFGVSRLDYSAMQRFWSELER